MSFPILEGTVATARHNSFYLESGPTDGTPIILVHGWPELAISWRHQMPLLASLGFRVIAPDMRGYGRSTSHPDVQDYRMEEHVTDLLELIAGLGIERAIWVGHDSGAAAVWAVASHHPERCIAVANLCVPYIPGGFTLKNLVALVNRDIYPADQYPYGQWAYWQHHVEHPAESDEVLDADVEHSVRAIFRSGDAAHFGKPSLAGMIKAPTGWKPVMEATRDFPRDEKVLDEEAFSAFVSNFRRNGFSRPTGGYRNNAANEAYAARSVNGGRLDMPVGFIHALYDMSCATIGSALSDPMRETCSNLSEYVVKAGHWVQQERPTEVNAALTHWLATSVGDSWRIEQP